MNSNYNFSRKNKSFKQLKKLAEQHLLEKPLQLNHSTSDKDKLINDLQVQQIELEMLNNDLQFLQTELEKSRNDYIKLFDFAPNGYLILDKNGVITKVNTAGSKLLGMERRKIISNRFAAFIQPDFKKTFYNFIIEVFQSKIKQDCELKLISNKGKELFVQL